MSDAAKISVSLPDGSKRELPAGSSAAVLAASIGKRLAADALAAKVNGQVVDLSRPLPDGASVEIVVPKHPDALDVYRHSTAHLTAQAVKRLFPGVRIGIGPAIEHGFYYDFDPGRPFSPEDLEKIEAEMRKIIAENVPIERLEMSKAEAVKIFAGQGDTLKVEIVSGIPEGELSCYRQGDFIDLCRGPHVPSTGKLGVFKLTHSAGAYWKGDERNPMLQRIYGASFLSQKELDEHLARLEAARERDHRKLGKELGLFMVHPWAPASPFFLPKGTVIYNELVEFVRELYRNSGYTEVVSPQIYDADLFRTSGHYDKFAENMYSTQIDEREFWVKPMNCPGHCLMFKGSHHSYRDLPVRFADFGRLHRYERSGVTQGLTRVRTFCQDDAHIYCTPEQMPAEIDSFVSLIDECYRVFGFPKVGIALSTRPESALGEPEKWVWAETILADGLKRRDIPFVINPGEGAFYGPKLEWQVEDAIGRPWQLGTLQLDFNMPERFDLEYVGEDNKPHRPIMLHRAMLGSLERFIGVLIEHVGGAFPVWLAPVQASILPVSDRFLDYADEVERKLHAAGVRVEVDRRSEKLGAKIRDGELKKLPWMLVVGEKEQAAGAVSVRVRGKGDQGSMPVGEFAELVRQKKESRSLEL
jgi:threonyl-tRNA synthetase